MKKLYVETSREDLLPEIQKICTDIETGCYCDGSYEKII